MGLFSFSHQPHTLGQNWDSEQFSLFQSPCLTHHVGPCLWVPRSRVCCWLELCMTVAWFTSPYEFQTAGLLFCQLQRQNLSIFMSLSTTKFCDSRRNPIWDNNGISFSQLTMLLLVFKTKQNICIHFLRIQENVHSHTTPAEGLRIGMNLFGQKYFHMHKET